MPLKAGFVIILQQDSWFCRQDERMSTPTAFISSQSLCSIFITVLHGTPRHIRH